MADHTSFDVSITVPTDGSVRLQNLDLHRSVHLRSDKEIPDDDPPDPWVINVAELGGGRLTAPLHERDLGPSGSPIHLLVEPDQNIDANALCDLAEQLQRPVNVFIGHADSWQGQVNRLEP